MAMGKLRYCNSLFINGRFLGSNMRKYGKYTRYRSDPDRLIERELKRKFFSRMVTIYIHVCDTSGKMLACKSD